MVKSLEDRNKGRARLLANHYGVEKLQAMSDRELLRIPNFGKKTLQQFRAIYGRSAPLPDWHNWGG